MQSYIKKEDVALRWVRDSLVYIFNLVGIKMSRTFRRTRDGSRVRDGKQDNMRHDLTPIREGLNQSLREEEKQYFNKFKEPKFNQKPKSRGGFW